MNSEKNPTFISTDIAYSRAVSYVKHHYENFPVISFLIPKHLRKHVAIIYWFARTADDFADESTLNDRERLEKLNELELSLKNSLAGKIENEYLFALSITISEKVLTPQSFYDLLIAFKQDVIKKRYKSFDEILDYCKHSANPVGRIILELFGIRDNNAKVYSDKICTALQLTNFLQDTMIDYEKGRIYLSNDEMTKFGVAENLFEESQNNLKLKQLIEHNVNRIQELFDEGKNLYSYLNGSLKKEIAWTVAGGEEILEQIRKNDYNIISFRPKLSKQKMIYLLVKELIRL